MGDLILILGGARSGKSDFAQKLARDLGGERVLFVATAEPGDDEMRERIAAHQQARPAGWRTLEAPDHAGEAILQASGSEPVILVDCLTLLVSNAVLRLGEAPPVRQAEADALAEVEGLLRAHGQSGAAMIVVSNEVGLAIVPDNALARSYRDALGRANQALAAHCDKVYWLVAGLPIELKALQGR